MPRPGTLGAHNGEDPAALGRVGAWRPLVHVRDIARITLGLLEAPREVVHAQAFNIGSAAQNVRIRDLAETLQRILGCDVELSDDATPDPRSYRVDFSKLASALPGLPFAYTPDLGAQELAEAYATVGLTREEFLEVGRYTRLAQIKRLLAEDRLADDLRWRAAPGS
jgi:nucleoside-diphosphate-sugar epimerase